MLKSFVGRRFWRIALDLATANAADRNAHAGVQQSQIIVDFSLGGHGRAWIASGVLLPDRYGGRDAAHFINLPLVPTPPGISGVNPKRIYTTARCLRLKRIESPPGVS